MSVEIFEFEPGPWSYKLGDVPSGGTFASRALIAAEQVKDKQAQAQARENGA